LLKKWQFCSKSLFLLFLTEFEISKSFHFSFLLNERVTEMRECDK
jgi:hypothetical protein